MRRNFKYLFILLIMTVFAANQALAGTIMGTTTGSGNATTIGGSPYYYFGMFNFSPPLNGPLLMNDLGQYRLEINSMGTVPAWDTNYYEPGVINNKGNYQWVLENITIAPGKPGATLYGSVLSWSFIPDYLYAPTGSVTGTLQSDDGFVHWYYGHDEDPGPPAGMSSLSLLGVSDIFDFTGRYTITNWSETDVAYILNGGVTANAVPEPATMALLGLGLMGVAGARRKMKR